MLASNALIQVTPGLMIWTILAFLITLFVLKRYAFGPIQKTIDERREQIRRSIEEADHAREEARKLLEEHRALIAQARQEAEKIRQEVRADAESMRERVREEVAELTLVAATKVTGKVLDQADHRRLIEDAIGELDFSALEGRDN